ncbi:MAG TPA: pitrilysin family protein [Candidatus Sumerlaeota bacterium]|nr:MAG: Peptidase M16 inactive domain protein [candidate division BRC1 bacterium ADurb.BinA292]HOE97165.1 pitrilysin family protein [Candidatus Sumerlaeota bacterium]HOR29432.1 pitrilysin family protein [Candidatus Sumerlaeota bacterium]HPK03194.1 pitrilysin family protein [Candidatus Sumerlaeota bacterium]
MIRRRTLPNGVQVVTEQLDTVRSCAIGVFLQVGSRHERPAENGISHFLEHMLFKGTSRRTARQIADATNYLGGNLNAFTTQELICLHAKTVDSKAPSTLDLFGEMLIDSIFPPEEIRRERQVVLEEFKMYEDTPDELSVDLFLRNLWPDHPLGRPVIGSRTSISRLSRAGIQRFLRRVFHPSRLLIVLSGSFDSRACSRAINQWFGKVEPAGAAAGRLGGRPPRAPRSRRTHLRRRIEQTHFCLGVPAPDRTSPDRFAFSLLNMILGGGMSSRLFQEIREKRGLAYSIGSFTQSFTDAGCFAVSGGTSPDTYGEVLRITLEELQRITEEPAPEEELVMAREQLVDSLLMSLENTESRMLRLADSLLNFGRVVPVDEILTQLRRVEPDDVRRIAAKYLTGASLALASIGPNAKMEPISENLRQVAA